MDWDLGSNGLLYLGAMSLAVGVLAQLLSGRGVPRWFWAAVTAASFAIGIVVSEVFFGWATEDELQPNIDGLSRDEALLGAVLTLALAVGVGRRWARRHASVHTPSHAAPHHRGHAHS